MNSPESRNPEPERIAANTFYEKFADLHQNAKDGSLIYFDKDDSSIRLADFYSLEGDFMCVAEYEVEVRRFTSRLLTFAHAFLQPDKPTTVSKTLYTASIMPVGSNKFLTHLTVEKTPEEDAHIFKLETPAVTQEDAILTIQQQLQKTWIPVSEGTFKEIKEMQQQSPYFNDEESAQLLQFATDIWCSAPLEEGWTKEARECSSDSSSVVAFLGRNTTVDRINGFFIFPDADSLSATAIVVAFLDNSTTPYCQTMRCHIISTDTALRPAFDEPIAHSQEERQHFLQKIQEAFHL